MRGTCTCPLQRTDGRLHGSPMPQHPTILPLPQRQHLATAIRQRGVAAVSRALGISRDVLAKLAGGLDVRAGNVALCQVNLPRLDAALTSTNHPPQAA